MPLYKSQDDRKKKSKNVIHEANDELEIAVSKTALFSEPAPARVHKKPDEVERSQKRKRYIRKRRKNKLAGFAVTMIFTAVILLVLVVNITQGKLDNRIRTNYVKHGVIEKKVSGIAYFLREEIKITASHSGRLVPVVSEGEKVGVGQVIAYIVSEGMEKYLNELRKIEQRISTAQNSKGESEALISEDVSVIDEEIERIRNEIAICSMKGNMYSFLNLKRELDSLFEMRNELTMNAESKDAYIQSLQQKRVELQNLLNGKMHKITTANAGVVSFHVDEAIGLFDTMDIKGVCQSELAILDTKISNTANKNVSYGEVVARITPGVSYYIAIDTDKLDGFEEGETVTVKARDRKYETNAKIVSVNEDVAILETSSALASCVSKRSVEVDVILQHQEGMKVPLRCLSDWDEAKVTARIALVRANFVEYVYVNVLARNDEYAIISSKTKFDDDATQGVKYNDIFFVNHEKVKEGEVVK
jgi:biotin carboxyl carrier protein